MSLEHPLEMQMLPYGRKILLCIQSPGAGRKQLPGVLTMVFPQDPPSRVGTAGRLFVPFEGHKALTMLSPTAWSLPFRPSAAPSDVELLGGKANRKGARRAGQRMGVLSGTPSVRLC